MRQPTIYLPHGGGPCFFMEWDPPHTWDRMQTWLAALPSTLPAVPKALLVISAHWETPTPEVTTANAPALIYDYHGFPAHTYTLRWPAPGSPELASRTTELLRAAGIRCVGNAQRGFDHGVFVPLKVAYPNAQIPTVQLSLQRGLDPATHLAFGRALQPLRDEGVLILGSGMSFHDLRSFGSPRALAASQQFDVWLQSTCAATPAERDAALTAWERAPAARQCHPREEHLLPLMVAAGAAGLDRGRTVFTDTVMGAVVSAVQFG
ncbi:MAG: dioxygenase [Planctomycetes bacterium]|jgi:aromatic ring-opening dioxygenase catalytic subunit (LigB family)|nr:dioxygenase [Planctomycetota bacterium]